MRGALVAAALFITTTSALAGTQAGIASLYRLCGHRTASGAVQNCGALTAAHRTLPFGTRVHVQHGGRSVVVRIIDRGPFVRGRIIDLTPAAARAVGIAGLGHVTLRW